MNTASESTSSNANYPPVAPPRTKRGAPKASTIHTNKALGASSKSPTAQHLKPQGKKLLQFFSFFFCYCFELSLVIIVISAIT